MAIDIGPKIGIRGETQFRDEMKRCDAAVRMYGTGMKKLTQELAGEENTIERLTKVNGLLEKQYDALKDAIEKQSQEVQRLTEAYGEADIRTIKATEKLYKYQEQLAKNRNSMKANVDAMEEYKNAQEQGISIGGKLNDVLGNLGLSMADLTMAGVVGGVVVAVKALVSAFSGAVTSGAEYADNISTISTNYGIAKEALQEYTYMAELADTSVDTITGSIQRLTKNMDEARKGTGEAADAFQLLGVNIFDSNGKLRDASDVFREAIDHLGYIEEGTERDALAMTLFGKSAMELNSLIATGAEGMSAYAEEARAMGYILSNEEIQALASVDDSFRRMDNMMTAVKNQIGAEMAPALKELADGLLDVAKQIDWREFGQAAATVIRELAPAVETLTVALADLVTSFADLLRLLHSGNEKTGGLLKFAAGAFGPLIPGLASGGVIEPNNPGLYVLGDNTTEREIVAPRSEMVGATLEALRMNASAGANITIRYTGDLAQLGRVLQPVVTADRARIGSVI